MIMVFNATFNNISGISWRSVLLVEETGVPWEKPRPAESHRQTLWHNVASSTPRHERDSTRWDQDLVQNRHRDHKSHLIKEKLVLVVKYLKMICLILNNNYWSSIDFSFLTYFIQIRLIVFAFITTAITYRY